MPIHHTTTFRSASLLLGASLSAMLIASWPNMAGAQEPTPVPQVNVEAPALPANLSPADIGTASPASGGMYVPEQSFGPFGALPAQDTPFATSSIPQAVIQDTQAKSLNEIFAL